LTLLAGGGGLADPYNGKRGCPTRRRVEDEGALAQTAQKERFRSPMNNHYAELAELAGGFIHDMKNHLSTLGLNLQLLAEDFQEPQSPRERRALTRIQRLQVECERLLDLSNDFLRFARMNHLELLPADLGRIVEEMVDFFGPTARAANIEIKSYVPTDLPPVALDRDLFKQALLNLMLNAEQAMPQGGEITVQATCEDGGSRIEDRGSKDNASQSSILDPPSSILDPPSSTVVLSLIDTGEGMPADVLARIFDPFFSTKTSGTGLGLPTTRKIVEAHHGTITAESAVGRGTRFTIRLPACSLPARPPVSEPQVQVAS